ncbi:Phage-related family protein [Xenorhabdus bovienii str. feltiae France]|nr:Phage-related family protein [Xenorhabdus bovienii str. feltiae France]
MPGYISRNRVQIEFAYRSSFLVGAAVDAMADDMTRKGISISSRMKPDAKGQLEKFWEDVGLWDELNNTLKWSRLYGGALLVLLIDGQDMATELNPDTIREGQFKGVMCLDRWMVKPSDSDLINDYGPYFGKPRFYKVVANQQGVPDWNIHYSRIIRMDGDSLPFQQARTENGWGMSVVERVFERVQAFDTATVGTAQLIHKAHLRTYSIKGLRQILATGGTMKEGLMKHLDMIREFQTIEGMTVMDEEDEFQTHSYSFSGIADVILRFAEQVSGATGIPLVRLFGQSPSGFSTGDGDLENYYSRVNTLQERRLRRPLRWLLDISHRSLFGEPLPDDFTFEFNKLWEMSDTDRSTMANNVASALSTLVDRQILPLHAAMADLRNLADVIGIGGSVTDEDIEEAKAQYEESEPETSSAPPLGNSLQQKSVGDSKPDKPTHNWLLRWFSGER